MIRDEINKYTKEKISNFRGLYKQKFDESTIEYKNRYSKLPKYDMVGIFSYRVLDEYEQKFDESLTDYKERIKTFPNLLSYKGTMFLDKGYNGAYSSPSEDRDIEVFIDNIEYKISIIETTGFHRSAWGYGFDSRKLFPIESYMDKYFPKDKQLNIKFADNISFKTIHDLDELQYGKFCDFINKAKEEHHKIQKIIKGL